jgi:GNAT superfamily N-acetyltransferase
MEVVVRTARPDDAADALLYESAAPYYAAYAGGPERARRLLRTPWRIPRLMRHLRATAVVAPHPPERMLYIDALATAREHRRRGVARALLDQADRMAVAAGLDGVALDTGIENRAARSLYERAGFSPSSLRPAPDERIARAVGGSGFVGYVKRR